jgi:antitoxin component YwqK of YwqJK toxin-antitoxin module
MKKLELTKDELEKLYHLPPKDVEKETEFQITYRMGRNSLVLELIKKINEELTPHIEYHPNGNVWIKGQENSVGQREGIWEMFYDNGNIRWRTPFKDGKEDGIAEGFCENGNIRWRIPYKEGKREDGIAEWFYPNGNIHFRTPFKDGNMDGIQEEFNEQGNIVKTTLWKNGEVIEETEPELTPYVEYHDNGNVAVKGQKNSVGQEEGIWEFFYSNGNIQYSNGNIQCRTTFKEDKRDGIGEWFWENGNIQCRTTYKEGKRDGIVEWFYPNGNIHWRIPYKDDRKDGTQNFYDEQGNIVKTTLWKEGELIETTKH